MVVMMGRKRRPGDKSVRLLAKNMENQVETIGAANIRGRLTQLRTKF